MANTVNVDLPAEIFDVQTNIPLIHQVVVAQLAAARQGTHSTKTRGEVRGGGRKPYRQKGTGRARQGSTRAPQFAEHLLVADLDLPEADRSEGAGSRPVDAGDGTAITVERRILSETPVPAYEPAPSERAEPLDDLGEVYAALVLGTRDYVRKNGFRSVILGLSGGIDSALVATIAADAPESRARTV